MTSKISAAEGEMGLNGLESLETPRFVREILVKPQSQDDTVCIESPDMPKIGRKTRNKKAELGCGLKVCATFMHNFDIFWSWRSLWFRVYFLCLQLTPDSLTSNFRIPSFHPDTATHGL